MDRPDFSFEEEIWQKDFLAVGIDEVGRGALAGPVVACAAYVYRMNKKTILKLGINDSKKLTAKKRRRLVPLIKKYFRTEIGEASVLEINKLGIVKATRLAMRRAVRNFQESNYFLLIDGLPIKNLPGGLKRQTAVVDGDQKSITIAAASVVAKVYRDKVMTGLGRRIAKYRWGKNKGYGTKYHIQALKTHGICEHHRDKFVDGIV